MDRIKIFQILIIFSILAIVVRLAYWQFFSNINSDFSPQEDEIPAPRGEIYTSDGFPLVTNQEAFLIYGKPKSLDTNPKTVAEKIAPFLISEKYATEEAKLTPQEEDTKKEEIKKIEEDLTKKLSDNKLYWVQLARKIPLPAKNGIESLNLKGIGFESDPKRFYPEASMAAQLLGFVAQDKFGEDTGYFGLEGYYDKQLRGKPGRVGQETDIFGFPILVRPYQATEPEQGSSLYLSIDRSIQFIVEEQLREAVEKYGAKDGTIIVADPKTDNILAMATYPTYSPTIFSEFDESLFKNSAVADPYEPGSTYKLVTMSAALDLSLVDPSSRCPVCSGPRQIGGYEISTWNKKYYPNSTMTQIIEHSDNVGMTYVAQKLGVDKFFSYITKFGFGKLTGIDLQEEVTGSVRAKDDWKPIDLATASFGQGIAVTPIQMVQAVQTIANHGKFLKPKVVEKIGQNGKITTVEDDSGKQVISEKTALQMTEMMVNAVVNGEAKFFAPKDYRIAGKTGTAQIPVAGHYDPNKTIASFVGFAPADDPKFVMLVRFTEPTTSQFGSETAAPTFFEIAKQLFNYFGISPTK